MAKQDYYEILGVSKSAEEREIKKGLQAPGHEISPGPQPG
ncbi:Chaperone protein DnaJ [Citrobacter freundii]|uniref:Chaperone protein DnaJ n=1 Tax=Citrobacter freundii TaxID=546 RepID=A0A7G2IGZ4_CITFR|nr:Chaperone protein DnaJ [Citrobacter freundii]